MRVENWDIALANHIESAQSEAWDWGKHDCVTFAMDCIDVQMSGPVAWLSEIRGRWSTAIGAARILKKEGGIRGALASRAPELPVRLCGRGDIVIVPGDGGDAAGVFDGVSVWVAASPGLSRVAISSATCAFRSEDIASCLN